MKKKRIASKLLSLLLSAAVIVTSSFSGVTLMDVSATEAQEQETVAVSENSVADVSVSANDTDVAEEETKEEAPVAEEPAEAPEVDKPAANDAEPVADSTTQKKEIVTAPQPYVSPDSYTSVGDEEDILKMTELPFSYDGNGEYASASVTDVAFGTETTLGTVEAPAQAPVPEKATTTPADSALVGSLVAETALANALLEIYNEQMGAELSLSSFKYLNLKELNGVVDLSTASNAASITKATGIGYLVNATEINLKGTKITYIPESEFWKNSKLVTITLPDTLVGFGDSAFNGCTALENINSISGTTVKENTLPSYLDDAKMGSNIFAGCTALETITIPSMENDAYALRPATSMFTGCTALTTVTVGADVAVIPNSCFVGAGDKTKGMTVTFEKNSVLDTLMDNAFQYCNIAELDLSNCPKLSRIGVRCFTPRQSTEKSSQTTASKIALQTLILPATNTAGLEIADEAFFVAPLKTICVGSYTDDAEGKVVLPNYVKSIGLAAFYGNKAMTDLQLSANLPMIPKFAFAECTALKNITVDTASNNNVCETIGIANQAFFNASNLTDADFLANMTKLTYIGEESWDIEDTGKEPTVKVIDYFSYKTSGYNAKTKYSSAVFTGTAIESAMLPKSLRTVAAGAFSSANSLETVTWAADPNLAAGAVYKIDSMAFKGCAALTSFRYPDTGLKNVSFEIWPYAFAFDTALTNFASTSVTDGDAKKNAMPISMTKLGLLAFEGCSSLQYMKITNNVKGACPEIAKGAFALCRSLEEVELPKSMTEIPAQLFYDCGLKKFPTFGGGVALEGIGDGAFFGNKMEEIDLSAYTKLVYIGLIEFAYHDPYTEAKDEKGNKITIVADEILGTVINEETGEEESFAETTQAPLVALVLPDAINGKTANMVWESNMLQMAGNFKTLKTKSRGAVGEVYIPNYVMQMGVGDSVLAGTAVTKTVWEFETLTSGANTWDAIPNGMFAFTPITDISTCCIKAENLTTIGSCAYAGTAIKKLDLTVYPKLKEMGDGVFALCPDLAQVSLPNNGICVKVPDGAFLVGDFENEVGLAIIDKDTVVRSVLSKIDFGKVTTIGKFAFATTDYTKVEKVGADYEDVLQKLDLRGTMVTTLDDGAFAGNTSLYTINLGNVTTLGGAAFRGCTNMDLTYDVNDPAQSNPLGTSLQSIGDYAFHLCTNIGEVVFGPELRSIGVSAFDTCIIADTEAKEAQENSGLTRVDFSNATKLASIGKNAFKDTAIKNFDITKTQVLEIKEGTVGSCPFLETITLGEKVQRVSANAAYGCLSLGSFEFYSTTTVDLKAFYKKGNYKTTDENDNIVYITPISKVGFRITPVELNVGLGNPMMFPYYVNAKTTGVTGEFGEIVIGEASVGSEDPTVHQYVKVMANTSKYYKNNTDPGNIVTDANYFEKTNSLEYKVNNTTVYTFKIQGLKPTPANTTVPFSVTSGYTFTADGGVSAEQTLTAKYNLKVMDIPYYPTFYTDRARIYQYGDLKANTATGMTVGTSNIRVNKENPSGKVTLYYDITPLYKTNWRPETGNLVVTTSDPSVIALSGAGMKKVDDKTIKIIAEPGKNKDVSLSSLTNNKTIVVAPKKQGSATVTVYPEGCPSRKVTWNINVKVDIKSIDLTPPSTVTKGLYEGDNFQVVNTITFYVGGSVTRRADTIKDYKQFTDNTINFFSSNTGLATVDANGVLTIVKSSKKAQTVMYGCIVTRPDGTKERFEKAIEYKYPAFNVGSAARSTKGEQVKITKKASGKKKAEVIYVAPKEGSTKVTIPATMVVGGVKCKVVGITDGAFKNNKTVKEVKISKGFKAIPKEMFYKCTSLTKVTLPTSITSIGASAFYGCKSLTKITIPKNVKTIGAKAFYKCSKLKKIIVKSKKVTSVGKNAFKGIYKKAVIDVPNSKRSTYKTLFKKGQGKKVKIK